MLSGLLSLALLGTAVLVGFRSELVLSLASSPHIRITRTKASARTILSQPAAKDADGEDDSDESSWSKQRTEEFGGSMSRYALGLLRTKLQHTAHTPRGALLPLFYLFCTLLI